MCRILTFNQPLVDKLVIADIWIAEHWRRRGFSLGCAPFPLWLHILFLSLQAENNQKLSS